MFFELAWRNIWRNPRRTAVMMTAIVIGVWSMIFLGALMRGMTDQMVRNGISTLTGHIQVHHKGYRNDPVIENSMTDPRQVVSILEKTLPSDLRWSLRVRVNAVVSNARHTAGVTFVGINPSQEAEISFIGTAVTQGRYLKDDDTYGILVGEALAEKFGTKSGRKMLVMSQDTDKEIASRAFRIVGIFRAEMEATEKQFVFVTMQAAQRMLKMKNGISEISLVLPDAKDVDTVAASLRAVLPAVNYEVLTWRELLPFVTAYLNIYDGFIFIWFIVVFIAMGFGIVNTTLMAVFERIREFGLLKALGMKPWWIIKEVLTESFFLLIVGMIIGNALSFGSVFALSRTGIDLSAFAAGSEYFGISRVIYPAVYMYDVIMANLVVFVLGLLVSVYPAVKAARFTPIEALAQT
jgi:ABC-type lipoprotein release transport system permease subunit